MKLRCADLFCGAGGFSEGFRQGGFHVTKALDLWAPAVLTHEKNHVDTEAIRGDILTYRPEDLGPIDVLIGSPPCTEFSYANRGGGGDIEAGLRLIYRFLRFVYELEPKWWVMENVPRTLDYLPESVPLTKLGIDKRGSLDIPVRAVLVSADYGVPQKRARAFSGSFPLPEKTHFEHPAPGQRRWRTLRDVVEGLPDPLHRSQLGEIVRDPVYGTELPAHELTDHFIPGLELTPEEVRENRKAKEDHSWYGRMSFPDELDRPGRTVMATQLRVSRETTVIGASGGGYRRLSIREASSVQAFPITYQWWGKSESLRYKLIGNAVAPPVAFAVANVILAAAGSPRSERPYVVAHVEHPAPDLVVAPRNERKLPLDRKFREHVPGSRVAGLRVDIDNAGSAPAVHRGWYVGRAHPRHLVEWRALLIRGSGKTVSHEFVPLADAVGRFALTVVGDRARERAAAFLADVATSLATVVPDATTLQAVRAERRACDVTPYAMLDLIAAVVDRHYQSAPRVVSLRARRSPAFVPQRTAAQLVAAAFACAVANEGTSWLAAHAEDAFPPLEGARPSRRLPSVDLARVLERSFAAALRRLGPGRRETADDAIEIERITISGA